MGQALYRKNRPKSLHDVLGQDHIVTTLQNAIKTGKISHAYLFTGPKGVGKTSVARILAHEVNKLPYNDESIHLDIIEIDAASNRRIDEIRELRDKVHISPTSGTYKVYIIDEVHMLTKEAFNALLKTLEEPPIHVIFILATTEAHKLPETIISRTQRFSFRPIEKSDMIKRLKDIARIEKIDIDDAALDLIAEHSDGSLRDSISLLDQARSSAKIITETEVQRILGIARKSAIQSLIGVLVNASPQDLLELLSQLRQQGYQSAHLAKQLAQRLRDDLIEGTSSIPVDTVTELLRQLLEVSASTQPDRLLEVILLGEVLKTYQGAFPPQLKKEPSKPVKNLLAPLKQTLPAPEQKIHASKATKPDQLLTQWPDILNKVKLQHSTLYSLLRMAEPRIEGNILTLEFQFAFHQKQVSDGKNIELLRGILKQYTPVPLTILCVTVKKDTTQATVAETSHVDTINSIFGGSEVLES
jgi:DNA polymerase-3 subunit gamma/tau